MVRATEEPWGQRRGRRRSPRASDQVTALALGGQHGAFASGGGGHVLRQKIHHAMAQTLEGVRIEGRIEIKIKIAHVFKDGRVRYERRILQRRSRSSGHQVSIDRPRSESGGLHPDKMFDELHLQLVEGKSTAAI